MTQTTTSAPPQAAIMQMLSGQIISRCIGLAADLAIADHLADGPLTVAALAEATETNAGALYRVLRLLAAFGIFVELSGREFGNSALSEALRTDAPGSVRHFARWFSDPLRWNALGNLDFSVRTGKSGVLKGQGDRGVFDVMQEFPDSVNTFNQAMTSISKGEGHAVVQAYDFTPYGRIVDVGGGHGFLATLIAQAAPQAQVTVYDLPHVTAGAVSSLAGLNGRVTAQGGNYLETIPGPADLIVMKNIVHGENDENALQLLRNCRQALTSDGRVLVIEAVISDGPAGNGARIMDIEMLFGPGGRQRTPDEHAALLAAAGLKLARIIATQTGGSMIEAVVV